MLGFPFYFHRPYFIVYLLFQKQSELISPLMLASLVAQTVKRLPAMWETWVRFLGREDPLEKEMAIPSSTLAWKIPWTEEPERTQSIASQRVGHDRVNLFYFTLL